VVHAHTAHDHGTADRQQAARRAFEAAGEQWTAMRATVFQVLLETAGPMGAYDVADKVSRNLDKRIAPNTVYRILDLFVAHNLVSRIESKNAFMASAHPEHADDCIFLVCGVCGKTTHIDDSAIATQVRAVASATGFLPERPVIEVQGRCSSCTEPAHAAQTPSTKLR
jgi:Fur family transcriptional regulator, zinc uptake regulator